MPAGLGSRPEVRSLSHPLARSHPRLFLPQKLKVEIAQVFAEIDCFQSAEER
uniref:Uncharacterized protein n=1 Tax=Terrapene triunguis TaxID=2587831 RepID=A0A674IMP2_9SAUR